MKPNNGDVEPLIPSGLMLNGRNWPQMAQIVVVETDFQPATDGKPQPMSAQARLDLGPLWGLSSCRYSQCTASLQRLKCEIMDHYTGKSK